MSDSVTPPRWAEALLVMAVKRSDRDAVSGDLLEAYRDSVVPARGSIAADAWYVRQVAGFLWRITWMWAVVFSGASLARMLYDWLVPTTDFAARAAVSTGTGVSVFFIVAVWAGWRSRSFVAGPVVAAVTSQVAALMSVAGAAVLFAVWHDPATMRAVAVSGGLGEVFFLPFMMIIPAVIVGSVGGAAGSVARRLLRAG